MQTAWLHRRLCSQLHKVCQGLIGSSSAPLLRRNSQHCVYIPGENFSSGSFDIKRIWSPVRSCGLSVSALAPWKYDYWSASRSEAGFKRFPATFHRATGVYGFVRHEEAGTRRPGTAVNCNSRGGNGILVHTKDEEEDEEELFGREIEDADRPEMRVLGGKREPNDSRSLQPLDVGRMQPTLKNFDFRELFIFPSSAELTRRVPSSRLGDAGVSISHFRSYSSIGASSRAKPGTRVDHTDAEATAFINSQRAVVTALGTNFLVFALKLGVWVMTTSHVMFAEAIHSLADLANQALIAYGLYSSRRAPDAMHPYGYIKERFVWSLISAVGIFCIGAGATVIHGVQNLWNAEPLENIYLAALVIAGSMVMEGASLLVAISCVRSGAKHEGMTVRDYLWRGHDPTSVAVMAEDGAAVAGLVIAGAALTAAHYTGNPMWDPIGSIVVGNLLGAVAIFLIQRNRHALLGRSMDEQDMMIVLNLLSKDPVVDAIYDCKSEVIGPGAYRFKAEIDFNGVNIVQNYIRRAGRGNWQKEFQEAVSSPEPGHLDRVMAAYGEEVVSALGSEVDRLEREIQRVVPGIRHVDIEAHNPNGPLPREKLYLPYKSNII